MIFRRDGYHFYFIFKQKNWMVGRYGHDSLNHEPCLYTASHSSVIFTRVCMYMRKKVYMVCSVSLTRFHAMYFSTLEL